MVKCLAQNVENLGLNDGRCRIVEKDVAQYLRKYTDTPFDVIFIDPPYGQGLLAPTLRSLQYGEFMNKNAMIAAEIENALTLPETGDSLEKIVDRSYGQTRIAIWTTPENK
jgi:16S rRNA (guanine966-N2)-methyltransferase